ncbi:hypothetical protein OPT61_g7529 [Boeremia exigua]|uniref:Uncharacterized protein n=1 Tax=Boeremia exigua TaxID=749465 RepID=A0ACC2I2Y5_9PLEO|nr:hypothetical protein OPT61_g7529 [Boeremia exigua]
MLADASAELAKCNACKEPKIRHPRKVFALIVLEKGSFEASVETANCGRFSSCKRCLEKSVQHTKVYSCQADDTATNAIETLTGASGMNLEVRQQYWQVAVARRRATEQRCFLQGRIGLEKKLHEYHLAKGAERRENSKQTYLGASRRAPNTRLKAASAYRARRGAARYSLLGGGRKVNGRQARRRKVSARASVGAKRAASVTATRQVVEPRAPGCYTSIAVTPETQSNRDARHCPAARRAASLWSRKRAASTNHAVQVQPPPRRP